MMVSKRRPMRRRRRKQSGRREVGVQRGEKGGGEVAYWGLRVNEERERRQE